MAGRRIEVKIITAGYYDNEDGKDFQSLTDEETDQFQNMIMALLVWITYFIFNVVNFVIFEFKLISIFKLKVHKRMEIWYIVFVFVW